jgi:hypothetical protein
VRKLTNVAVQSARVTAVHEQDAIELLDRLGVAEAYRAGTLVCAICGTPLLDGGLGAARRKGQDIEFGCSRLDCLEEFHTA